MYPRPQSSDHHHISTIGIPTRNRTASLKRCIESFHIHAQSVEREIEFCIIDNSTTQEALASNKAMLEAFADTSGASIHYFNTEQREELAARLAQQLSIAASITRFALLGDDRCSDSYGACRNALLLYTAGKLSIQTDDDTICCLSEPTGKQAGLTISGKNDPNEYSLFLKEQDALDSATSTSDNLFSLHESVLGKPVLHILGEFLQQGNHPEIINANTQITEMIAHPDARVSTSFLGIVGDTGMHSHAFRLFLEDVVQNPNEDAPLTFEQLMTTRWIQKSVSKTILSTGPFCMTTHIGIDTRRLLPPFMPVMRNEDGVFGIVKTSCSPASFSAYLPGMLHHRPHIERTPLSFDQATRFPNMRTNDLLSQLIYYARLEAGDSLSLEMLGDHLVDLGSYTNESFKAYLLDKVITTLKHNIAYARWFVEQNSSANRAWQKSIETYIDSMRQATENPMPGLLTDLDGKMYGRLNLFQDLAKQYGTLLKHWESIIECSQLVGYKKI